MATELTTSEEPESVQAVMKLGGWTSLGVFERCVRPNLNDARRAPDKLGRNVDLPGFFQDAQERKAE